MSLNLDPIRISPKRAALFLFCIAWFSLLAWWHRGVVVDDPWITFRYARNLVEGHGLVFNEGEYVEGFSNPTWVLVSTLPVYANIEPLSFARFAGFLFGAALLGLLCFGAGDPRREIRDEFDSGQSYLPRSGLGALLLVSAFPFAVWSISGLETALYTLLLFIYAGTLARAWNDGTLSSGILSGLCLFAVAASRPEGAMFFVLHAAVVAGNWNGPARKALVAGSVTFLLTFGLFLLGRVSYYGEFLPNTAAAKIGGGLVSSFARGLGYLWGFFSGPAILLVIFAAVAVVLRVRALMTDSDVVYTDRVLTVACGAVLLQAFFIIAVGGDWMPASRFIVPVLPLLCLMAAAALLRLPGFVRFVIVMFMLAAGFMDARNSPDIRWYRYAATYTEQRLVVEPLYRAADWLEKNTGPEDTLAGSEAGILPYQSRLYFIDMLGLVDKHIADLPGAMHESIDATYILSRKPDFIAIQYADFGTGPTIPWPADRSVVQHPDFDASYEQAAQFDRPLANEKWELRPGWLTIYRRKDS